jgi:multiple sugar transport system ATP-binding protein
MAGIRLDGVTCRYPGAAAPAVDALDLRIADGEFFVLLGPSGCGKTTILRLVAGLETVTAGTIRIGDRDVTRLPTRERDVAMVFQEYVLYPHLSVAENIGFPLELAGAHPTDIAPRVQEVARLLRLEGLLDRRPGTLSGGERQRVALGRAIARRPRVFLMDEPLSNLDGRSRTEVRADIAALQRRLGVTTVYVTHDQGEARRMGDRIAVLREGRLQQVGTPDELYDRPADLFVAGFLGSPAMNLLDVALTERGASVGGRYLPLPSRVLAALAEEGATTATIGFRPEAAELTDPAEGLLVEVVVVEEIGAETFAYGAPDAEWRLLAPDQLLAVRVDARTPPGRGDRVGVRIPGDRLHVFSPRSGRRIPADDPGVP